MSGPVVVGLDGSPASVTAAWWAAREAADRRLPVVLLHSWCTQPLDLPSRQEAHARRDYGEEALGRTSAELLQRHPALSLTTELVRSPAAQVLLERGENASMLVLGSRGHDSVAGFLVGSISLHVLGLAPCPAVAVRAGDPAVEAGRDHPAAADRDEVVVGVQEPGAASDPLLEFAFTEAGAHGARLRAVRALPVCSMTGPAGTDPEAEERTRLAETMAPWRDKFPDVSVAEHVATGTAAHVLLAATAHGCLTVVGRRLHLSQLTWKLGPVAHAALHHVPCPVAVVPHD
ncbi:universal stress protein [Streptomyces sp. M41]|uniref:universal stress protein n=1 Tax=Streptomyces sp. M41 TaxID=3059412 RepID=UPI00374C9F36